MSLENISTHILQCDFISVPYQRSLLQNQHMFGGNYRPLSEKNGDKAGFDKRLRLIRNADSILSVGFQMSFK